MTQVIGCKPNRKTCRFDNILRLDILCYGEQSLILFVIVCYAVYFLCDETNKQVWLLVLTMAVTALAMLLPDVILGGIRSTKARYLFPTYLGMQIAVAYLLAAKIRRLCQAGNGKCGLF